MLTERERLCLEYLDHLMEAKACSIGRFIYDAQSRYDGSNFSAIGAAVVGRLRKQGLVLYLPDLHAWRISRAGREQISKQNA